MEQHEDEISLKELILKAKETRKYLWSKKWPLMALAIAGATIGVVLALVAKTKYTATLTFALAESEGSMGSLGSVASQFGFDIGGGSSGAFSGDNILELMKSRTLFEKTMLQESNSNPSKPLVAQYLISHTDSLAKPKKGQAPSIRFDVNNKPLNYWQDSFMGALHEGFNKEKLSVSKIDKKLSIIKVELIDTDPVFAKEFTEGLVENVTRFYVETKNKQAIKHIRLLEIKVDSVRRVLNSNMVGLAVETDGNQLLIRNTPRVQQGKKQLDVQLLTVMYGELVKNLELTRTMFAREQPLIQVIDLPKYPLKKTKASKAINGVVGMFIGFFIGSVCFLLLRFYRSLID